MSARGSLQERVVAGAIAGIVGTVLMTAAMRRLHRRLPPEERYPLPPREITEIASPPMSEETTAGLSMLAHAGFGAAAGAAMASARITRPTGGGAWGLLVWLASYFGWVPLGGILRPASSHPARRNALMILVHLVWGAATALSARELLEAQRTMLAGGALRDATDSQPRSRA